MVISVHDEEEDDIYTSDSAEDQKSNWMDNAPNERQLGHCVSFNVPTLVAATSSSYPVRGRRQSVRIDSQNTFRSIIMESQRLVRQMFSQISVF
jgi:hypothetical protein